MYRLKAVLLAPLGVLRLAAIGVLLLVGSFICFLATIGDMLVCPTPLSLARRLSQGGKGIVSIADKWSNVLRLSHEISCSCPDHLQCLPVSDIVCTSTNAEAATRVEYQSSVLMYAHICQSEYVFEKLLWAWRQLEWICPFRIWTWYQRDRIPDVVCNCLQEKAPSTPSCLEMLPSPLHSEGAGQSHRFHHGVKACPLRVTSWPIASQQVKCIACHVLPRDKGHLIHAQPEQLFYPVQLYMSGFSSIYQCTHGNAFEFAWLQISCVIRHKLTFSESHDWYIWRDLVG